MLDDVVDVEVVLLVVVEVVVVEEVVVAPASKNSIVRGGITISKFTQLNSSLSRSLPPDQSSSTISFEL